tara:strand:- start:54801 stop:55238 length:438 start_codon:yes stop_codon:yes gene_type:complete
MVFFFARNIVLVETNHMDSWMGGGMRMFGKIDKMLYRVSGFTVEHKNKTYFVNLRSVDEFDDEDVKGRILPNDKRLNEILKEIKKHTWIYNSETDKITIKKNNSSFNNGEIIESNKIKSLKVYKVKFNANNKKVNLELINHADNL